MKHDQQRRNSGTGRKIVKGTGKVVLAPFRAVGQSGKLTKDQYLKTFRYGKNTFSEASNTIQENWRQSSKAGRNDQFFDIFGGPDGPELLQKNLRRFLLKKRVALGMMALFVVYGVVCVVAFQAFSALMGMLGAVMLGVTFATESQFRLWQLRKHRLSVEEKGSFPDFWRDEPILQILNPELLRGHRHGS